MEFWFATFERQLPEELEESAAAPLYTPQGRGLALEVIRNGSDYAVLFSISDDLDAPSCPSCRIGFANNVEECSRWRDRGFPLVDADIRMDGKTLIIVSPHFAGPAETSMRYTSQLIQVADIEFAADVKSDKDLSIVYEQFEQGPDSIRPATGLIRKLVRWPFGRSYIRELAQPQVNFMLAPARSPSLIPFGTARLKRAWSGTLDWPPKAVFPRIKPQRARRADVFGEAEFRFEDVEVLGFRVDLRGRDYGRVLEKLVEPLNFHLAQPAGRANGRAWNALSDFRYRPATRTLLIELLRYGKMRLKTPSAPLTADDYQSQHELVVRLLVGRVDDDTSQAHDPAVFVPAIFVDNPWSKTVGRDVQGFDKRMASFCITAGAQSVPLLPDGRRIDADLLESVSSSRAWMPEPLGNITSINLATRAGDGGGRTIMELDCLPHRFEDWDAFQKVDLDLALGSLSLVGTRWHQGDFDQAEFRRSFASTAIRRTLRGFRSIQVSPVGEARLERTWITGSFEIDDDPRIARPHGVASVRLHATPAAPPGWNLLCGLLGSAWLSFPTGSWYRLKCSMSLTIDDGLDWSSSRI